jgi:hypothetical protein
VATGWEPIRREGHPDPVELASGERVRVVVRLSEAPPPEWAAHFLALYSDFMKRSPDDDWPMPQVIGTGIVSWPQENDLTRWIQLMDERIDQTNKDYQTKELPEKERREAEADEAAQKRKERLERLRREAEEL